MSSTITCNEINSESIVSVFPSTLKLHFDPKKKRVHQDFVKLINLTENSVGVKVKTNAYKIFCVKPIIALLKPKEEMNFTVRSKIRSEAECENSKHYLTFQAIKTANEAQTTSNPDHLNSLFENVENLKNSQMIILSVEYTNSDNNEFSFFQCSESKKKLSQNENEIVNDNKNSLEKIKTKHGEFGFSPFSNDKGSDEIRTYERKYDLLMNDYVILNRDYQIAKKAKSNEISTNNLNVLEKEKPKLGNIIIKIVKGDRLYQFFSCVIIIIILGIMMKCQIN